jgi:PKD repeat protein
VTSTPAGINCGAACSGVYNTGTSVVLTAVPDSGYVFAGWSGGCSGTGICAVSMSANAAVAATYVLAPYIQNIRIIEPQEGSIIGKSYTLIRGTVTATSADIGITVNGIPADIYGNNWVVNSVPLPEGLTAITAIAKDINGNTVTRAVSLTRINMAGITLSANVRSGAAPLSVYFSARTNISNQVQLYEIDFEGTGTFVASGQNFDDVTHTYNAEGIYYATLRVTDTSGGEYSDTIAITVISKTGLNTLLTQKWAGMKSALIAGDIDKALTYFVSASQPRYRSKLTQLTSVQINLIFSNIIDLTVGRVSDNAAQCGAIRQEPSGIYSYPVLFVRGENGIWLIAGF